MKAILTFKHANPKRRHALRWAVASAAILIAAAAPAVACEKSLPKWIAAMQGEPQTLATFTGDLVNGVPVYRLPSITVVARRDAELAKGQRGPSHAQAVRSPARSTPTPPTSQRKVASEACGAIAPKPCIG